MTSPGGTQGLLLEMIRGEPNSISGRQNEVFIWLLIWYGKSAARVFTEGENKRAVKRQIKVVLRPISLVKKKEGIKKEKREK